MSTSEADSNRAHAYAQPRHAVHRTILVVDVEGFADQRRTNAHQIAVREGLYRALRTACERTDIPWHACHREDRGDGLLLLAPPDVPKSPFVERLPQELIRALRDHNNTNPAEVRIRLRVALHAGEIHYDAHGVAGTSLNLAFRLLAADGLKAALADSFGDLAVINSSWFFEEVTRHCPDANPDTYRPIQAVVKETTTTAWICLPDHPYTPRESPRESRSTMQVPRQLPAAVRHFVGRSAELDALTAMVDRSSGAGATAVISAQDGQAGIGKTALAIRWAHRVAERFPDGQLYVNLRGFDSAGPPTTPADAIRAFLDAFAVPAERIPVSLEEQAALYRSLVAQRRILIVLDNARDAAHVRPLLPAAVGCVVLITSRSPLPSLGAVEGAHAIKLGPLHSSEARDMVSRRLGPGRVAAEPDAVDDLISQCGRLPLTLAIVAARAATQPGFPLTVLAKELREVRASLAGEEDANTQAVLAWAYQGLSSTSARMFRLLGIHPGPDITTPAAASLAGFRRAHAGRALEELSRAQLVHQHTPGRFALHDLLRTFASHQAHTDETADERRAAAQRVLDHYLHTAHPASLLLEPRPVRMAVAPPRPGVVPEDLADQRQALAWFDAEHPILLATIRHAARAGVDTHAWQLARSLTHFFDHRGNWQQWAATQRAALDAAERLGDRKRQARAHQALGCACARLGSDDSAYMHYRYALDLFTELDDQASQAYTHSTLVWVCERQGRPDEALAHANQALEKAEAADHLEGQARALNAVGWCRTRLGDHLRGLDCCRQALSLQRELGDQAGEAETLSSLGYAHHHLGHHHHAIAYYQQSLDLYRKLGYRSHEAAALTRLGDTHHAAGDLDAARDAWQHALAILNQLTHPDADQVRNTLVTLDQSPLDQSAVDQSALNEPPADRSGVEQPPQPSRSQG